MASFSLVGVAATRIDLVGSAIVDPDVLVLYGGDSSTILWGTTIDGGSASGGQTMTIDGGDSTVNSAFAGVELAGSV